MTNRQIGQLLGARWALFTDAGYQKDAQKQDAARDALASAFGIHISRRAANDIVRGFNDGIATYHNAKLNGKTGADIMAHSLTQFGLLGPKLTRKEREEEHRALVAKAVAGGNL